MLITNKDKCNSFDDILKKNISSLTSLDICVGFCGLSTINDYEKSFIDIAKKGRVRLILGMYSYQGAFSQKLYNKLSLLNSKLHAESDYSGVLVTKNPYHGKIYCLCANNIRQYYVGSCNFSAEGLFNRKEAQIQVRDPNTTKQIEQYVAEIASDCIPINLVNYTEKPDATGLASITNLKKIPNNLVKDNVSGAISLRVWEQPRSGLNLCLSSGRVDSKGRYTPRPWYEVELSVNKEDREQDVYPKTPNSTITIKGQKTNNRCVFQAILHYRETNEYYPCKMATYSDYNKAMCTDGNRHLLGEFIKSRLEKLGLLKVGDQITQNILLSYGAECIEIERFTDINKPIKDDLSNKVYLITF